MIQTECKGCGQKLKLADDMAGKRARCPSCGDPVKVPVASPSGSSPEPPRAAPPPERPRPMPPPPRRPSPVASAAPPPPASANPFDFLAPAPPGPAPPPSRSPAPVAQLVPPADAELAFSASAPALGGATARRGRPLTRQLASYGALVCAAASVALLMLLGPSDDKIEDALGRLARGKITVDHVRGGLVGLIGGLLVGSAIVAVVGRSLSSVMVGCLVVLVGVVFGVIRQASAGEVPVFLLLAAAFGGVILGAVLGGLLGAVAGLARE